MADWFLQQRGHGYGKGAIWTNRHMGEKYCQDDVPVKEQTANSRGMLCVQCTCIPARLMLARQKMIRVIPGDP
jgi:hypothetical protein